MGLTYQGEFPDGPEPGVSGNVSTLGLAVIIRAEISRSGKGVREMTRCKVISERTRRNFYDRLEGGLLSTTELNAVLSFLKIDPVKAMLAIRLMQDPLSYFDPTCETLATMAEELAYAMQEHFAALHGDFTPIHRNLCKVQASKLAREMVNHSERSKQYQERGFE
jgi:hypothetical protein